MDILEIKALHQRTFQRVRRLSGHEAWNGTMDVAIPILVKELGGAVYLARIIAEENGYTNEERQKLERRINTSGYGIRDAEILQMVVEIWESLDRRPDRSCIKIVEVESGSFDESTMIARLQRLEQFKDFKGSFLDAFSILYKCVGGAKTVANKLQQLNHFSQEEEKEFLKRMSQVFYKNKPLQLSDLKLFCLAWDALLSDPGNISLDLDKPYKKATELVNRIIKNWDISNSPEKSLKDAIEILAEKLGGARALVRTLEEENYPATRKTDETIKEFFNDVTHFIHNDIRPHQSVFDCALNFWQKIFEMPKVPLHKPYEEASQLVRQLRKYPESWNGTLFEAITILNEAYGGVKKVFDLLKTSANLDEKDWKFLTARASPSGLAHGAGYIFKDDLDLLLTVWQMPLPEKPPKPKYMRPGCVDLNKDYPAATALVRRQLGMRDWSGTLAESLSNLKRLGGSYVLARMLSLPKDQEQRIACFLRNIGTTNPREKDLQCVLKAWSVMLDRRARGVTGDALAAPIRRSRSDQTVRSSLNDMMDTPQHCPLEPRQMSKPGGNCL